MIAAAASRLEGTVDFETAAIIHKACCGYCRRTEVMMRLTNLTMSSFWWQILETN
uniref:Uncharacterized protein n=1 Tax=Rhizophora mucronata TaxID=61149 RepID=A0A2P2NJ26_RHIMU